MPCQGTRLCMCGDRGVYLLLHFAVNTKLLLKNNLLHKYLEIRWRVLGVQFRGKGWADIAKAQLSVQFRRTPEQTLFWWNGPFSEFYSQPDVLKLHLLSVKNWRNAINHLWAWYARTCTWLCHEDPNVALIWRRQSPLTAKLSKKSSYPNNPWRSWNSNK